MKFGEKLKYLRNIAGLNQADMAKGLAISIEESENFENLDSAESLDVHTIVKLSELLDVSLDSLLSEADTFEYDYNCNFNYLQPNCITTDNDFLQILEELGSIVSTSNLSSNNKKVYIKALRIVSDL